MKRRALAAAATLGILLVGAANASSAPAASPWWHLSSGARPTVLRAGTAKDEVQELTVSATKGDIVLVDPVAVKEVENGERESKNCCSRSFPSTRARSSCRKDSKASIRTGRCMQPKGPAAKQTARPT